MQLINLISIKNHRTLVILVNIKTKPAHDLGIVRADVRAGSQNTSFLSVYFYMIERDANISVIDCKKILLVI